MPIKKEKRENKRDKRTTKAAGTPTTVTNRDQKVNARSLRKRAYVGGERLNAR